MSKEPEALGRWLVEHLDDADLMTGGPAPDPDLVVAYVEGRLSEEEGAAVEALLARSESGRALLAAAVDAGVAAPAAAPKKAGRLLTFAVAAAAVVAVGVGLFAFGFIEWPTSEESTEVLLARAFDGARAADPEAMGDFTPLSAAEIEDGDAPVERGGIIQWEPAFTVIGAGSQVFRWQGFPSATSYRLQVFDEDGTTLHDVTVAEPQLAVDPDTLRLYPGKAYVWQVTTETSDGPAKGVQGFRVAPAELTRRYRRGLERLRTEAGPQLARLAEAHLAVRFGFWAQARLLAQAHVRNHPGSEAGRKLLARIHRQLGMPGSP